MAIFGAILAATWVLSRIFGSLIFKAVAKLSLQVARQSRRIVTWLIWLIGVLVALDQLGLDLTILLVIVALVGVLAIIALRDILSSVASHEAITTYNPFKIGDWIQVDRVFGRVVDLTWINTVLMTPDNEMVYVPNSKIIKSIVINKTIPGGTRISVPFEVNRTMDLSKVERILLEIGSELHEELASESKPEVRVTHITDSFIRLVLLLKINNPAKGKLVASDVRKMAKRRLDELESEL